MTGRARPVFPADGAGEFRSGKERALALLLQAHEDAHDLGCAVWDFAVELGCFAADGVTHSDLRWLLQGGYAQQRVERANGRRARRGFGPPAGLALCARSCFVLTAKGVEAARALGQEEPDYASAAAHSQRPGRPACPCFQTRPDGSRELVLGGRVVKRYRVHAGNQELILASFQEQGWVRRIDDPLPPVEGMDPKLRLRDTIAKLNRRQVDPLVRFHGDGAGCGVYWEAVANKAATGRQQRGR